jgi:hypothetical protein
MTGKSDKDTVRRPILMATALCIRLAGFGALSYVAFLGVRWAIWQPEFSAFSGAVLVGSLAAFALALSSTRHLLRQLSGAPNENSFQWIDGRTVSVARVLSGAGARPAGQR